MTTDTIKAIQKQIVVKLEAGEDISELTRQLTQERAKIASQAEIEQLKKITDERRQLRDKADVIRGKVQKQDAAINSFLKARDGIIKALTPILEQAKKLPELQAKCYEQYRGPGDLVWIKKVPKGYLPKGLAVPMLDTEDGVTDSYDRAAQAVWYIGAGLGSLQGLKREDRPIPEKPAGEFDGALGSGTSEIELNCLVCNHEKTAEINKALQDGRPLRDIEAEYQVSRSTLSRHRNRCLNLGAIRIRE